MKKIAFVNFLLFGFLVINAQIVEYFDVTTIDMYKAYNFNDTINVELSLEEALENKERTFFFKGDVFSYILDPALPSRVLEEKELDTIHFWPAVYDQLLYDKLALDLLLQFGNNKVENKEDSNIYESPYPQKLFVVEKIGQYYILHCVKRKFIGIEFSMG